MSFLRSGEGKSVAEILARNGVDFLAVRRRTQGAWDVGPLPGAHVREVQRAIRVRRGLADAF